MTWLGRGNHSDGHATAFIHDSQSSPKLPGIDATCSYCGHVRPFSGRAGDPDIRYDERDLDLCDPHYRTVSGLSQKGAKKGNTK